MNSFSDYREGSATAEYRAMVDKAAAVAEHQKARVDPMYHEKIDHLLDTYARKLAENMNQGFAIDARVPSVMIAGPANFPVRQKEKQNRARDGNMEEWRHIQGLLDKIRSTGMGGISADDPAAVEKLQKKLDSLERSQLIMKEVNAYYRKHGTLDVKIRENGVFAPGGYVAADPGAFIEYYHGPEDIPKEHRVFAYPKEAEPARSILKAIREFQEAPPAPRKDKAGLSHEER